MYGTVIAISSTEIGENMQPTNRERRHRDTYPPVSIRLQSSKKGRIALTDSALSSALDCSKRTQLRRLDCARFQADCREYGFKRAKALQKKRRAHWRNVKYVDGVLGIVGADLGDTDRTTLNSDQRLAYFKRDCTKSEVDETSKPRITAADRAARLADNKRFGKH